MSPRTELSPIEALPPDFVHDDDDDDDDDADDDDISKK